MSPVLPRPAPIEALHLSLVLPRYARLLRLLMDHDYRSHRVRAGSGVLAPRRRQAVAPARRAHSSRHNSVPDVAAWREIHRIGGSCSSTQEAASPVCRLTVTSSIRALRAPIHGRGWQVELDVLEG